MAGDMDVPPVKLTASHVAARIGVHPKTLWKHIGRGAGFPPFRQDTPRSRRWWDAADVDRWLETQARRPR